MRRFVTTLALLLAACGEPDARPSPAAPAPPSQRPKAQPDLELGPGPSLAFVHVNVIPMDKERVLKDRTVVVQAGTIMAVNQKPPPKGATVVDAKGRTLMPGLSDMHVHNWYEEDHVLFLANGVTRIRNLWGTPMHLKWKREIESGRRVGPRLHTTGPILDGEHPIWEKSVPLKTPKEAIAQVRKLKAEGYESVKVYNGLKPAVYAALVKEARKLKLRVTGHVPYAVGIDRALAQRQDCIEHLEGYVLWPPRLSAHRQAQLVSLTKAAGTWNCPTLVVYRMFRPPEEAEKLRARPQMRFVPPRLRATWDPQKDFRTKDLNGRQFRMIREGDQLRSAFAKALHDATGRILAGTDTGNPFVIAGWSLHEELQFLVDAGLTPYQALSCATTKPAEYLQDGHGTIAPGEHADLILLEENPLEDVAHARKPLGVMANGRWFTREQLDAMLEDVAASYEKPRDRFKDMPQEPVWDGRYEIFWNGLVVGEERFVLEWGMQIRVQQVNDPPADTRKTVTLRRALDKSVRIHATIEDRGGSRAYDAQGKPGEAWGASILAGWAWTAERFKDAKLNEEVAFDFFELDMDAVPPAKSVKTIPTRVTRTAERTYRLVMQHADGTYTSTLELDDKGWPVVLRTVLQQGTVEYRLVK